MMKLNYLLLLEAMSKEEAYKILDITDDSDIIDIKSKYRKLSKIHHPDLGGDPNKFLKVQAAFEKAKQEETLNKIIRKAKPEFQKEEKEKFYANKLSSELFKLANKLRKKILEFKRTLSGAIEWQRLIADALTADVYRRLDDGELEVKKLLGEMKKIYLKVKEEEIKKENIVSDETKEIEEGLEKVDDIIETFEDIVDFSISDHNIE